jgi:hypothetical protein
VGLNNLGSPCGGVFGVIVSVWLSIVYAVARAVFGLVVLCGRGAAAKDVELVVLRREVSVLGRQVRRPTLERKDRLVVAALCCLLPGRVRYHNHPNRRARRPDPRIPDRGVITANDDAIDVLEPHSVVVRARVGFGELRPALVRRGDDATGLAAFWTTFESALLKRERGNFSLRGCIRRAMGDPSGRRYRYAAHRRFAKGLAVRRGRLGAGDCAPLQAKAHWGSCGKAPVVPQNRWPRLGAARTGGSEWVVVDVEVAPGVGRALGWSPRRPRDALCW